MSWIVSGLWSVRIPHLLFDLLISLFPLKKQGGGEGGMGLWGCGVVGLWRGWTGSGGGVVWKNFVNAKSGLDVYV